MFGLATVNDLNKIIKSIKTVDRQIYEIQKKIYGINPNLVKQNVEQFLNEEDVKYCKLSINNLYTQLTATNEDVKKHYEETKNAIITLQKQITDLHRKYLEAAGLGRETVRSVLANLDPPDYSPTHSLEVIIDSQKHTIIDLQASKEKLMELHQKNAKKVEELEYANKMLQEHNTKLENDKIVVKYITYDGVDIDHLQFRLNQAEKQVSEFMQQNSQLRDQKYRLEMSNETYIEQIRLLNEKIKQIENTDVFWKSRYDDLKIMNRQVEAERNHFKDLYGRLTNGTLTTYNRADHENLKDEIGQLKAKIKFLEIEKKDLETENRRMKFFH